MRTMDTTQRAPGLVLRILPFGRYTRGPGSVVERSMRVHSRTWVIMVSGFAEPVVYLVAFQIGFGALVGQVAGPGGQPVDYVAFVAPALLAASAMNGAIFETTYPVFFKLRYAKVYDAMLATPLGPVDIALGEISWAVIRGGAYSVAFVVVMMGLVGSPFALLLVPAALLVSFAFASVGMALSTFLRSPSQFDYIRLMVMPLFLFSATFYPVSVYPDSVRWLVQVSPLYHGVELMRGLAAGVLDPSMIGHIGVLAALAAVGVAATSRRIGALLLG
ncbi:MAG: ABC transporter [Actinophytocola sp.]|nr:ABC transporter [Actinophytocola sp.]